MAYMEQLQSALTGLVAAGEAGRKDADSMLGPLNGAIGSITGAASELENIPFVPPEVNTCVIGSQRVCQFAPLHQRFVAR